MKIMNDDIDLDCKDYLSSIQHYLDMENWELKARTDLWIARQRRRWPVNCANIQFTIFIKEDPSTKQTDYW